MKKYLPNLCTLLNLSIGSLGILFALKGHSIYAISCVWLGALFDFCDGWLARLLKVSSPLGKQLDSFADLVTFGCLPASIMYTLIDAQTNSLYFPCVSLLIPNCSAIRLAKFNIDTKQNNMFIGLPVPAHGIFISTLPLIIDANKYTWLTQFLIQPSTLAALVLFTSYLLIANIKLVSFKFTTYRWHYNRFQYSFLFAAASLILFFQAEGLALSIILYVLASVVMFRLQRE